MEIRFLKQSCHVLCFILYAFAVWYDTFVIVYGWGDYGGKFKFLTFINLVLQTLYFGLALLNDVVGSHTKPSDKDKKTSKLQSFLNTFYASLAFPVGTEAGLNLYLLQSFGHFQIKLLAEEYKKKRAYFVVVTFWCIYAVDRELVYPTRLDGIIPGWMNHIMHTTVLPLLLIEKYICYHEFPSKKKGLTVLLGFALAYLLWILWVAFYADFWVYPILQVMAAHQRVIFITVLMAFFISIYILGDAINSFLWRKEIAILRQKGRPQKGSKQNGKPAKSKSNADNAKSEKQNRAQDKQNGKMVKPAGKAGKQKQKQKAKMS